MGNAETQSILGTRHWTKTRKTKNHNTEIYKDE